MYFKIASSNIAQDETISLAVEGDYLAFLSLLRYGWLEFCLSAFLDTAVSFRVWFRLLEMLTGQQNLI